MRTAVGRGMAIVGCCAALCACGRSEERIAHQVLRAIDQGKLLGTKGTMETMSTALNAYQIDRGSYPAAQSIDQATAALVPAFLRGPVGPDAWGNPLTYQSDGRSYMLTAPGPDGRVGGGDDLVMVDGKFTRIPSPTSP